MHVLKCAWQYQTLNGFDFEFRFPFEMMLNVKLKLKPIQFTAYWIIAITDKMKEFSVHLYITA